MSHAQEVVDDLKPLVASRKINRRDIHHSLELALRMVSKEVQGWDNARWSSVESELVLINAVLLDEFRKALDEIRAVGV